ncbi:TorD/DmsD family molecular chaperone [Sporomusa sphaeroides]|uniref:TorD/DmsD family molecular chaperone n=1 Tax=Sporomusa sphaeroides TaxID=47679 RepID=UPI002B8F07A2|nr:molecular chaperone TorD family protein [Sporomusa sphaeroides]HML31190.1 molecular chaperone TorD family protein [Sporomusa sphaeroides]
MFLHPQTDTGNDTKELASLLPLLEARVFAYDLLRRTFLQEPVQDFLVRLSQNELAMAFPFQEENEDIAQGVQKLATYLKQCSAEGLAQTEYEKLHWEYTRLFIGPYEVAAPPWESVYLNKDKLLFQQETRLVRLAYLKYSFLPLLYQQEADDHIGLECDFMYQLAALAYEKAGANNREALQEVIQDHADFLAEHLLLWVPAFAEKVTAHATTVFYQGAVQVLSGFLAVDALILQELLASKQ